MTREEILACLDPDEPCFTEAELTRLGVLPVPEWMRKPPKLKNRNKQPELFDEDE
jgi:hypothetical protein